MDDAAAYSLQLDVYSCRACAPIFSYVLYDYYYIHKTHIVFIHKIFDSLDHASSCKYTLFFFVLYESRQRVYAI